MADAPTMSAHELVRKVLSSEHADLVREGLVFLVQQIMEHEVAEVAGAGPPPAGHDRRRPALGLRGRLRA